MILNMTLNPLSFVFSSDLFFLFSAGKRKTGEESGNVVKKLKSEASLEHPSFYYSIHRHSIKGMNMPK